MQYNEPLVTDDLQAERLKKFDGIKQYSRDKRRQVGAPAGHARNTAAAAAAGVFAYLHMHPVARRLGGEPSPVWLPLTCCPPNPHRREQVALAERFSERWAAAGHGSRAYAMHPGWTETEGVKTSIPGFYSAFKNRLRSLQQGCDTTVWLCVEVRGHSARVCGWPTE